MSAATSQRISVVNSIVLSGPMIIIASRCQERLDRIIITPNISSLTVSTEGCGVDNRVIAPDPSRSAKHQGSGGTSSLKPQYVHVRKW